MGEARLLLEPVPASASPPEVTALVSRVAETLQRRLLLRIPCEPVPPGSLPRFELKARRVVRVD